MSRNTHRQCVAAQDLREELAIAVAQRLRCTSDDVRQVVDAVVDHLIAEHGGFDLYLPAARGDLDGQIVAALVSGASDWAVRKRFRIGYQRLQRLKQQRRGS